MSTPPADDATSTPGPPGTAASPSALLFTGLSAFPLTPVRDGDVDEAALARLVTRLREAGVDSVGALGSTGSYAYLTRAQRARAAGVAVEAAGEVPVVVGIGAVATAEVLALAEDAQAAGAAAVLLAPVSYQALTPDEVFGLYEDVTAQLSVPLCVYDNPATTHVTFTDELYARIARLPGVGALKIPPLPADPVAAAERLGALRAVLPDGVAVAVGVSGDARAVTGLSAGADAWFSVVGGLFPEVALAITRAARAGDAPRAASLSAGLEPLWALFARYGSVRVTADAAELLGLVAHPSLPRPLRGLPPQGRHATAAALRAAGLLA